MPHQAKIKKPHGAGALLSNTLPATLHHTGCNRGLLQAPIILFMRSLLSTFGQIGKIFHSNIFQRSLFSSQHWLPAMAVYVASIGLLICVFLWLSLRLLWILVGVSFVQLWWYVPLVERNLSRKLSYSMVKSDPWICFVMFQEVARWWFQGCFIFTPSWVNDPIWLICFFFWVETTT